jgi:hypothetical protein
MFPFLSRIRENGNGDTQIKSDSVLPHRQPVFAHMQQLPGNFRESLSATPGKKKNDGGLGWQSRKNGM